MNNTDNNNKQTNKPKNIALPESCVKKSDRIFLHTEKEEDCILDKGDGVM